MDRLQVGDRIRLFGGYDPYPRWLPDKDHHFATVLGFIDNEIKGRVDDERLSAIIEFDEELEFEGLTGRFGYIMGRWEKQQWLRSRIVHVHLTDIKIVEAKQITEDNSRWMESHACYETVAT
jgi:hypothetical protein